MTHSNTLSKSIFLNAPKESVWKFLTDKDLLGQWYHPAKADLREGQAYELLDRKDDGSTFTIVWGDVIEMTPCSKLVTTFCISPFDGKETRVTWQLEDAHGGTKVSLTHDGIAEASGDSALHIFMSLDAGWDSHFVRLRGKAKDD